jgi:hypothetical protein
MTADAHTTLLTAILDSLSLMQGQLEQIEQRVDNVERELSELHGRLDHIDAAQAGITGIVPTLEIMLARMIEDRQFAAASFATLADIGAFTNAAVAGRPAPLPVDVAGDPLLERFLLNQPADYDSPVRALVEWRQTVHDAGTAELAQILARQYQPSPTDTAETRVLRYQLAAITRAELTGRRAALPDVPPSTIASDRSVLSRKVKSEELSRFWQGGATTDLFAEAELAGAVDLFADVEHRSGTSSDEQMSSDLARLHGQIANEIAWGGRPALGGRMSFDSSDRTAHIEPDKDAGRSG